MEKYPVWPSAEQSEMGSAQRANGEVSVVGGGAAIHRRRRAGARILEGRGKDEQELRQASSERREALSNWRPGEISGGWRDRVSGSRGSAGEGARIRRGIGGNRGSADAARKCERGCGRSGGRTEWEQEVGCLCGGGGQTSYSLRERSEFNWRSSSTRSGCQFV